MSAYDEIYNYIISEAEKVRQEGFDGVCLEMPNLQINYIVPKLEIIYKRVVIDGDELYIDF